MNEDQKSGGKEWVEPDDAPELTDSFFDHADIYKAGTLVRRGRPKLESPKAQVTLRLDADVLAGLRATGPGWQARANAAIKQWLATQQRRPG